jgi:hypothetical protein
MASWIHPQYGHCDRLAPLSTLYSIPTGGIDWNVWESSIAKWTADDFARLDISAADYQCWKKTMLKCMRRRR